MKKVVLTTMVVVIAAIAAQAQSARTEVAIANAGFYGAFAQKTKQIALNQTVDRKVTQKVNEKKQEAAAADKKQGTPEQKPAAANAKKASQPKPVAAKKQTSGKTSWVNAFFGGRYPGEAKEDYRTRLSALAQPSLNK